MKAFCVIPNNKVLEALSNGIILRQSSVIKTKNDCMSILSSVAFENNGAVLFEIDDKVAKENFSGELYVEGTCLMPINPDTLGIEQGIVKKCYNQCIDNKRNIRTALLKQAQKEIKENAATSTQSILSKLNQEQLSQFTIEYNIASKNAKQENIKNAHKAAFMTALRKVGV